MMLALKPNSWDHGFHFRFVEHVEQEHVLGDGRMRDLSPRKLRLLGFLMSIGESVGKIRIPMLSNEFLNSRARHANAVSRFLWTFRRESSWIIEVSPWRPVRSRHAIAIRFPIRKLEFRAK